ncbi:uncharacterized protein CEXT_108101 [Caerostris extrusa]|uniref:Transmembrane protein n=1 Tax=Caerostris extrusa TaxID=172846 RepID=A0AAV4RDV7_CAEEX|nr:uncharacterized protein CEXT_108101 [Caerostris extrusa]
MQKEEKVPFHFRLPFPMHSGDKERGGMDGCVITRKSQFTEKRKLPATARKRKQNQRLGTMSRARFVFLLSSIVGLHFICMNFSCLNVARLNNEHLQCRTLSLPVCVLWSSSFESNHPHVFLLLPLNISWRPSFRLFVRLRSLSEHERLKKRERRHVDSIGEQQCCST